mmetsp:Transcript_82564/g.242273  ORF Transcript_82564/g.242273 Transcript_82564/m.242273 type:complete len:372 (-) Transcript_82564:3-1118(-)
MSSVNRRFCGSSCTLPCIRGDVFFRPSCVPKGYEPPPVGSLNDFCDAAVGNAVATRVMLDGMLRRAKRLSNEVVSGPMADDDHGATIGLSQHCFNSCLVALDGPLPLLLVARLNSPFHVRILRHDARLVLPIMLCTPWQGLLLSILQHGQGIRRVQPPVGKQIAEAPLDADAQVQHLRHGRGRLQGTPEGRAEEASDGGCACRCSDLLRLVRRHLLSLPLPQDVQQRVHARLPPGAVAEHQDPPPLPWRALGSAPDPAEEPSGAATGGLQLLVVDLPRVGVGQDAVSRLEALEGLLRAGRRVLVGVDLECSSPELGLDHALGAPVRHADDVVVISGKQNTMAGGIVAAWRGGVAAALHPAGQHRYWMTGQP